ncbi:MAG: ATP-binding protein [Anaerolineaceae bacterium]|nr:ATP-binding protein [Anaerolineaceae bacterium]
MNHNNPFTFGNPIREKSRFIGRKEEINQIISRLLSSAHESTSIVGERRIGKTSLLKHLANPDVAEELGLAKNEFCLVYIDFQGLTDISPIRFWKRVLRLMERSMNNDDIRSEIEKLRKQEEIDLFDLEDLFDLIDDNNLNVVLFMDEFEFVTQNPNFGGDFFGGLRSLAIHYSLSLVPSTRRELVDLCHSDEIKGSPFFNIFATVVLRPFSFEDAQVLLQAYTKDTEHSFSDEEISFLLNLAGGYPIFTQMGGNYLFTGKKNGLSATMLLEYAIESFQDQANQHFSYFWVHSSDSEKITLLASITLNNAKNRNKNPSSQENFKKLNVRAPLDLHELVKRGMMIENNGEYKIFSPIFENWILLEVSALPGEEESAQDVERWLKESGNDKLGVEKEKYFQIKKKYWKSFGAFLKDFSTEVISKITIDMVTGRL